MDVILSLYSVNLGFLIAYVIVSVITIATVTLKPQHVMILMIGVISPIAMLCLFVIHELSSGIHYHQVERRFE